MTVPQWWAVMEPARIALERVIAGNPFIGTPVGSDDAGTIGLVFNQTWLRLQKIPGRHGDMVLLELALRILELLCNARGVRQPSVDEAHMLKVAMNLVDRTVRLCTPLQWAGTELQIIKIVQQGAALA